MSSGIHFIKALAGIGLHVFVFSFPFVFLVCNLVFKNTTLKLP